jgi:hypothetical protein
MKLKETYFFLFGLIRICYSQNFDGLLNNKILNMWLGDGVLDPPVLYLAERNIEEIVNGTFCGWSYIYQLHLGILALKFKIIC